MHCANCGLENPPSAEVCDCGYDFSSKEVRQSASRGVPLAGPASSVTRSVLSVTLIVAVSLLAFDVFGDGFKFWLRSMALESWRALGPAGGATRVRELMVDFMPTLILVIALTAGSRREWAGVLTLVFFGSRGLVGPSDLWSGKLIAGSCFVAALLFLTNRRKSLREPPPQAPLALWRRAFAGPSTSLGRWSLGLFGLAELAFGLVRSAGLPIGVAVFLLFAAIVTALGAMSVGNERSALLALPLIEAAALVIGGHVQSLLTALLSARLVPGTLGVVALNLLPTLAMVVALVAHGPSPCAPLPLARRVLFGPNTGFGRWSLGLFGVAAGLLIWTADPLQRLLVVAVLPMALTALIAGLIAIVLRRERSLVMVLPVAVGPLAVRVLLAFTQFRLKF
jgi:hypothetical protein